MSDFNEITREFFFKEGDEPVRNRRSDCNYRYDYSAVFQEIADRKSGESKSHRKREWEEFERQAYRKLLTDDLFFMVHFGMGILAANHPFVVDRCREVEDGPITDTLDVWARGHYKSVILTTAETVQQILRNPEDCHLIFSYKAAKAQDFLAAVRSVLERPFLVWCFPEILYQDASREAESWSLQGGITVKRKSIGRKECTVSASGLVDGQPTGGHYERIVWDDCETADIAENPDQLQVLINKFEVSQNLFTMTEKDRGRVIGTFYSHCGLLTHLRDKKTIHGQPAYKVRIIPATVDGTRDGEPVLLTRELLDKKKGDRTFNSQQLCNPLPGDELRLDYSMVVHVDQKDLPKKRKKFILIDPAGDDSVQSGSGDKWAMVCVSVVPVLDDLGTSAIYIEDAIVGRMSLAEAVDAACTIYMRNGRITCLGIEKTAGDTTYDHVIKALKAKGRYVKLKTNKKEPGNVVLLSPSGRNKNKRIESALAWPLSNSQVHLSDGVSREARETIKVEMNAFPYYHSDLLDAISYVYDILTEMGVQFQREMQEDRSFYTEVREQSVYLR